MAFQNQLRKSWGKKGNDAQTAILILKSIPKKTYYILFVSIVNFVALVKINKQFNRPTQGHSLDL
jgi:hypothetical protein